jgi:hypothetical protein
VIDSWLWREFSLFLLVVIVLEYSNLSNMNYEFLYVWIYVDNFLTAGIYAKALEVFLLLFDGLLLYNYGKIVKLNSVNHAIQIWITTYMDQNGSNFNFFMFCCSCFLNWFSTGVSTILKEPFKKTNFERAVFKLKKLRHKKHLKSNLSMLK